MSFTTFGLGLLVLLSSSLLLVDPLFVWGALLVGLFYLVLKGQRLFAAFLAVCFLVGAARTTKLQQNYYDKHVLARQLRGLESCELSGRIVSSPVMRQGQLYFKFVPEKSFCPTTQLVHGQIALSLDTAVKELSEHELLRGDRLELIAQLGVVQASMRFGSVDPLSRYFQEEIHYSGKITAVLRAEHHMSLAAWIDRARDRVRRRIFKSYPLAAQALARALVLGESDLEPEQNLAFQRSGLAHLLAVSGSHLVVAVSLVVSLIRALLTRLSAFAATRDCGAWAASFGAPLALLYSDFAGGSGSAWRAGYMLAAVYTVRIFGYRLAALVALSGSCFFGWLLSPLLLFDISFALSVAATWALLALHPSLSRKWRAALRLGFLAEALSASVCSLVACVPLLSLLGDRASIAGLFANLVAGPVGEILSLPLCLLHTLLFFWPALEEGVALVAAASLDFVAWIAQLVGGWDAAMLRVPLFARAAWAPLFLLAILRIFQISWRHSLLTASAAFLFLFAAKRLDHAGELEVTVLDVGQGDSILIRFPDKSAWLIDAGGVPGTDLDVGARQVLPALRQAGVESLDKVLLSHPHPDHYLGLSTIIQEIPVQEFWWTASFDGRKGGMSRLFSELDRQKIKISSPDDFCGSHHIAGVEVEVLSPCPHGHLDWSLNDQSIVMRLKYEGRSILLVGDAEEQSEEELLHSSVDLKADVLKLGHHGSRTSSSQTWLSKVKPDLAIASCGARNRFLHPHPEVVERLRLGAIRLGRTDWDGAISTKITASGELLTKRARFSMPQFRSNSALLDSDWAAPSSGKLAHEP